jgi:Spy/CpxP family protein refolding chaperone
MKKLIGLFVIALGISTVATAQKGDRDQMSVSQKTDLAIKKMTLKLDLTSSQQNQIKPLLEEQIAEKEKMHSKRKERKESGKKPTADERYAFLNAKLDKQIAFKSKMKNILDEKQYEKFEKFSDRKMEKMKRKMRHKRKGGRDHDNHEGHEDRD